MENKKLFWAALIALILFLLSGCGTQKKLSNGIDSQYHGTYIEGCSSHEITVSGWGFTLDGFGSNEYGSCDDYYPQFANNFGEDQDCYVLVGMDMILIVDGNGLSAIQTNPSANCTLTKI